MDEQEIFTAALEREPAERPAFLAQACGSNVELRQRVERLLRLHSDAGSFLESQSINPVSTVHFRVLQRPGDQIGPYKLLQQIGEGGMGLVYMAEQSAPVRRRVALKIIKPGMDTRQVIARFEAERQALAMMDHPNIARVLDAGTTATGWPYFVMELVNGIPVTQFCDEQHLNTRERLELFIPICQAVQHAHQKGIIHRDIKPNNILVALYNGQPVPKVIDFGVAKATNQQLTERTLFTALGQIVGTLEYMSPEQATRNQLDVDTRSDVYSLGVVLYELLTGDTPFDKHRLRSTALDEILRIIREEDPPRPSSKLSGSAILPSVAANRRIEPARLSVLIRGELDWIAIKALEKERSRRYESAGQFAADVRRYLDNETVLACPPSSAYRLRKFVRRNWKAVSVSLLMVVTLMAGLAGTIWQARRAKQSERITKASLEAKELARREERIQRQRAEDATRESQRRLSRRYVAEGNRHVAANDPFAALPWFVAAIDVDREDAERQALHRLRINSIIDQSPKLNHVLQHEAPVDCAAFSRDGLRLATGARNGTAHVWNVAGGHCEHGPLPHDAGVRFTAFSEDGRLLLTTSGYRWKGQPHIGRKVHLWDLTTGQPLFPPVEHDGVISFAQLTPDNQRLVTLQSREVFRDMFRMTARLIDAKTGELVKELCTADSTNAPVAKAALSSDGRYCAVALGGSLSLYETEHGRPLWTQPVADVESICFGAGDNQFAVSRVIYSQESQRQVSDLRVWNTVTGDSLGSTLLPGCQAADSWFTKDGRHIGVVGRNGSFWIGEIESGNRRDETHNDGLWRSNSNQPLWISPKRTHLATTFVTDWPLLDAARGCQVWNLITGQRLPFLLHHAGAINHAAFHPDGHLLATCGEDHDVRIWNLARERPTAPSVDYLYPADYIDWLKLSDDGQRVLVGYAKIGVQLWDAQSGRTLLPTRPVSDSRDLPYYVSPDCRKIYYVSSTNSLQSMDVVTGEVVTIVSELAEEQYSLRCLVHFAPRRHYVATRSRGTAGMCWRIWSGDDQGTTVVELPDDADGYLQWSAFSPNGRYFALASHWRDGQIVVFDTTSGKEVARTQRHEDIGEAIEHMVVVFSPDEARLVVGRSFGDEKGQAVDARFAFQVLDLQRGQPLREPDVSKGFLRDARFSEDSRRFLLCVDSRRLKWAETTQSDWNEVSIWNSESGKQLSAPLRHSDHALANFSHNGRMIATTCDDGGARVWDVSTSVVLATYQASEPLEGDIAFSDTDRKLALSTASSAVHIIDPLTGEAITPPLVAPGAPRSLRFAEDDRELVAVCHAPGGPVLIRWPLDDSGDDVSMARLSKWLSLQATDDALTTVPLVESPGQSTAFDAADLYSDIPSRVSEDHRRVAWHQQLANACANGDYREVAIFHFNWLSDHDAASWKPLLNRGAVQQRRTHYYAAFERRPDWPSVIADYSAAIQRAPDEVIARRFRVEATAASGGLPEADDLALIWRRTLDIETGSQLALVRLASGDTVGYRTQCEALAKILPCAPESEEMLIWVCLLSPQGVADRTLVLERAEAAFHDSDRRYKPGVPADIGVMRNYAAALLRTGRAVEAVSVLLQCNEHGKGYMLSEVWVLLSLAYSQSGDDQESAVWRAKAEKAFKEAGDHLAWTDREILRSLLSQAAHPAERK